jgi:hypothetical protein
MNERSMLRGLGPLFCVCLATSSMAQPMVVPATPPSPFPLAMSRVSDRSIAVRLAGIARPGVTRVELRNLRDQTITSVDVDTSAARPTFALPAPWNGELRITRPAAPGVPAAVAFVGVVVEPVLPDVAGGPPRIIFGPNGRTSVRFAERGNPPERAQVVITSPAMSAPAPPAGSVGDPVEIAFMPSLPRPTTGVVGLTPWSPPARALVVNVFDPATRRWSALHSHVGHDGTVFATGPLPGVYALTVAQ